MNYVTDLIESRQPDMSDDLIWELDSCRVKDPDMEFGFGQGLGSNMGLQLVGMDSKYDSKQFEVKASDGDTFLREEDDGSMLFALPGNWLIGGLNLNSPFTLFIDKKNVALLQDEKEWAVIEPLPTRNLKDIQIKNEKQRKGVEIIENALKTPTFTNAPNVGEDATLVLRKLLESNDQNLGYDVVKGQYIYNLRHIEFQFLAYEYERSFCSVVDPRKWRLVDDFYVSYDTYDALVGACIALRSIQEVKRIFGSMFNSEMYLDLYMINRVLVGSTEWVYSGGRIENVFERKRKILDPPIFLVFFRKAELVDEGTIREWKSQLRHFGYELVFCNVDAKSGLDMLQYILREQTNVIVRPSVFGKLSLINALRGNKVVVGDIEDDNQFELILGRKWFDEQCVGEVSTIKNGREKHTARNVSLLPLSGGGYLTYTSRCNQPSLMKVTKQFLALCIPHIQKLLEQDKVGKCSFNDCLHICEPWCLLKAPFVDELINGLENQSIQKLENYVAYIAEKTTHIVYNCLKIAEDIREYATEPLLALHQGEQMSRTHMFMAALDNGLSEGKKLWESLGCIFSKTWKLKKTPLITGLVIIRDEPTQRKK